jgi:hypothetical protein
MKILLDCNAKVGGEDMFKPSAGNESSHETNNDNGIGVVNFATSKNLIVKSKVFLHCNMHNRCGLLLMGKYTTSSYIDR